MNIADLSDIITLYGDAVYGFCYRLTGNKNDADDLYQETFLKAVEICHKIDRDNNPKAFLIAIAVRVGKNKRKKYAWRQRIAPTVMGDEEVEQAKSLQDNVTPEDIIISHEQCRKVQAAVEELNDKLKVPLYMYYTAELSVAEIAQALKIPQGTVKSRLHKARKTLKTILEPLNFDADGWGG